MPNNTIITSPENPLFVLNNEPYTEAAQNGQVFDITTGEQDVAANGFLALMLTVPADCEKTIYALRLLGGSSVNSTLDITRNSSIPSGTSVTPVNNNWDYSGGSQCTAQYVSQGTDPVSGGDILLAIVQTGGGLLLPFDGRIVIPSSTVDRTLCMCLRNKANQANLCSITMAYWEI